MSSTNVLKNNNSIGIYDVFYLRTSNWSTISEIQSWLKEKKLKESQ